MGSISENTEKIAQALGGVVSEDTDRSKKITVSGAGSKLAIVDEISGTRVLLQDKNGHNLTSHPFGQNAHVDVDPSNGRVMVSQTQEGVVHCMTLRKDATATMDFYPQKVKFI